MISSIFLKDGYKVGHKFQYPPETEYVYSNFTPRSNAYSNIPVDGVVVFGIKYLVAKYLQEDFTRSFFVRPRHEIEREYKTLMDEYLGPDSVPVDHILALHNLGYLPIRVKALPEGVICPFGVPLLTITNTDPEFYWVTNMLETLISCVLWKPITVATIAHAYRKLFDFYAELTGADKEFTKFQGHDFSMRGMSGPEDAAICGAAHLLSFVGTDCIPGILAAKKYYSADGLVGVSVPATEHSVMCMGSSQGEFETFERLITDIYPSGIVSIVSDTWDFWRVVTDFLPKLKDKILAREGKVVIRPDSGDPVKIICGDPDAVEEFEKKGLIQCLWDVFGGTETTKGYKVLDSHIGAIYGDSITYGRAEKIMKGLFDKGFASSNIVLGIGSYTYQYITRDTFGFAMKATSGVINGERVDIFKDPKTGNGFKKSAKGLLRVDYDENDTITLFDQCTEREEIGGLLKTFFVNGRMEIPPLRCNQANFENVKKLLFSN